VICWQSSLAGSSAHALAVQGEFCVSKAQLALRTAIVARRSVKSASVLAPEGEAQMK
jgi:hypothetical protein